MPNTSDQNSLPTQQQILSPLVISCVAATWFVWGSTYLAIKFALVSLPPFIQMGSRFIVAGAVLLVWMKLRGATMPNLLQWRNALIVGALMLGGGMGGTAYAEQTIASGLVVAFIACQPVIQAVLLSFWGIKPKPLELCGIAIGLIGVALLVTGQGMSGSNQGLVAISIAITAWGLGSVLSQKVTPLAPGATGFASEMIMGGIVLMAMSWISGEQVRLPIDPLAIAAWVYLVFFGSLIAFNAYMILLAQASPALATSYSFVNPVIAMLLGITFAGEIISPREWVSVGIILVGVFLIVLAAMQARKKTLLPN